MNDVLKGAVEFCDRYSAIGIPYPEPATVCRGHCEGTGSVPVYMNVPTRPARALSTNVERDPRLIDAWKAQHAQTHSLGNRFRIAFKYHYLAWIWTGRRGVCDGWHFVKCTDCGGTGKRPA